MSELHIPSAVCEQLIEDRKLPDSLIEFIYYYLVKEVKDKTLFTYDVEHIFDSVRKVVGEVKPVNRDATFFFAYTILFRHVLSSIPHFEEKHEGLFNVTVGQLYNSNIGLWEQLEERGLSSVLLDHAGNRDDLTDAETALLLRISLPKQMFPFQVSIDLPDKARFEHTHILGGTGSGKTVMLKHLITKDIEKDASIVVMAPKGDLIPDLLSLDCIDPDRLVVIRPEDCMKHPIAINLFDMKVGDEGEAISAVSMLNFVFAGILDAETTSMQTGLFNHMIRLMMVIPNATILDLQKLLAEGSLPEEYIPYLDKLSDQGKRFFLKDFGDANYKKTKAGVSWRINTFLENPFIEKIFSQTETRLDINDALNKGKVILIDTSIKNLGEFGSQFFGRFFIALINRASQQRGNKAKPVYFYIDEASQYLDRNIESMLALARESRVGITLAHQQLSHLSDVSSSLLRSVHANTATKIVGRCSQSDASAMSKEIGNIEAGTLKRPPTHAFHLHSAHLKHITLQVKASYRDFENLPRRSESEIDAIIKKNRTKYCVKQGKKPIKIQTNEEKLHASDSPIVTWDDL